MAECHVTLSIRKRWWFWLAYSFGLVAFVLRFMSETRAERYIAWMIENGIVVDVH